MLLDFRIKNATKRQQYVTWCNFASILPVSVVRVTKTARSARVIKATLDSGLDLSNIIELSTHLQIKVITWSLSG